MMISFDPREADQRRAVLLLCTSFGEDVSQGSVDTQATQASQNASDPQATQASQSGPDTQKAQASQGNTDTHSAEARQTLDELDPLAPTSTIPEAPAPDPQAGVALDSAGTPWIAEVHATTKTFKADGTWKKKRGVDDELVKQTEAAAREKIAGLPTPAPAPEEIPVAEPVTTTLQDVTNAYQAAVNSGKIDSNGMMGLYGQLGIDPASLPVNETARAQLVEYLSAL